MKKSLNININKDESNINDYLQLWSEFGERPNKISIFHSFDSVPFDEVLSSYEVLSSSYTSEIYPTGKDSLENIKKLVQISNEIYISYTIFDSRVEESFIGDVFIYFKTSSEEVVNELVDKLEKIIEKDDIEEISENSFYTLILDQTGYELAPMSFLSADYENIDLYFNDDVLKESKKLVKKLSKEDKGISVLYGERGTGKTTLASHILQQIDKRKVFLPSTMIDTTVNNSEFRNFLTKNKNLVLVVDDAEIFITDNILKTQTFSKNLLQLVEGIDSDNFDVQVILIVNTNDEEDLEEIIESNYLNQVIRVDNLTLDKSVELSKFLKKNKKFKKSQKLIDILTKKERKQSEPEIGYE